ncbi:MAG TPA: ACP S-malonyltransferase [Luteibacter sp.]|uniref:ACP S-malonyltransferase n=1 Tax=Luteibacter sp. TaxID=1886636 RepID=UPI002D0202F5|nr:ACP S-malonyltransferase [Luteibacter sp.]HVI53490.1 ACP S-malonyltransferase [Luteibacter sp.]
MKTILLFAGQGSHHFQMGRELFERDPVFRSTVLHLDSLLQKHGGESVVGVVFADGNVRELAFDRLLHSHCAIFMVEYALAMSLIARGVRVDLVLGASLGAFAAAAVAGCVDPETALSAVVAQALAVEAHGEAGGMIAVMGEPENYLTPELLALCEVGARNFATHAVLSAPEANLVAVEDHLRRQGLACHRLPVRYAFHSRWIDGAREPFARFLRGMPLRRGALPVACCATGTVSDALPEDHFWSAVRDPVLLLKTLELLESQGSYRYIDVSPAGTMGTFLKYALPAESTSRIHHVMSPFGGDMVRLAALEPRKMKAVIFPGQGSQFRGMGKDLFPLFPEEVGQASEILGYSIEDLCVNDRQGLLSQTQYTQPALFVVNALHHYRQRAQQPDMAPDFFAGHSLGEYNALLAAGVFSFETGVRLVKKRGELMGKASGGGMAAVLGVPASEVRAMLDEHGLTKIDIANFNTPTQTVIAGDKEALAAATDLFARMDVRCVTLNVSAPFHSRHMQAAHAEFAAFLDQFSFAAPEVTVIANATARPYDGSRVAETLARQIATPVQWVDSIRYVMGKGDIEFHEVGASVLSKMVSEIRRTEAPIVEDAPSTRPLDGMARSESSIEPAVGPAPKEASTAIPATSLGSPVFQRRFGLKYAYMAGAMYRGVASADLVIRMGKAGLLSFFGAGGLSPAKIETNLVRIQAELAAGQPYGMNLLANYEYPAREEAVVDLYLRHGVKNVEAAAFMQMTPALVRFRLQGLRMNERNELVCDHRIVAKVSRPEVATAFMSPAPRAIVESLLERRQITPQQAEWSQRVPVSDDICVEADSGGHTDGGIAAVMLPPMLRLRDEMQRRHRYAEPICMGLAGGIGGPEAASAAFLLGADFIVTGSINQCTVEAGMSADGKSMLQEMDIQDTEYAPAGDMFEMGAQVQVLKKSVFFPARANKLLSLYRHHESLDDIPARTRQQLEGTFFKKTFDEIWHETAGYLRSAQMEHEVAKAEANPKHKMALVFRWYFTHCTRVAMEGAGTDRVNYQIHTGPALGSFNQWVKGTELEPWTNRHVDDIALKIMEAAADHLTRSYARFHRH